jgi:hypothetical protein
MSIAARKGRNREWYPDVCAAWRDAYELAYQHSLSGFDYRVLSAIWKLTGGYSRAVSHESVRQITAAAGLREHRASEVSKSLHRLADWGVILYQPAKQRGRGSLVGLHMERPSVGDQLHRSVGDRPIHPEEYPEKKAVEDAVLNNGVSTRGEESGVALAARRAAGEEPVAAASIPGSGSDLVSQPAEPRFENGICSHCRASLYGPHDFDNPGKHRPDCSKAGV